MNPEALRPPKMALPRAGYGSDYSILTSRMGGELQ